MKNKKLPGSRIAKVLARAGLCSRREAERWVLAGDVSVNGIILETPATIVQEKDLIIVKGTMVPKIKETKLWLFHKLPGFVTTHKDPNNRPTVFEQLPPNLPRVISVGRLDLNSEGLLLLSNNGELTRKLELPKTGWVRRYRVRVYGPLDYQSLIDLKNGITIDGIKYDSIYVKVESKNGTNAWLGIELKEGKNREIRNVMRYLGLQVNRLIRISYGPFQLGSLPRGQVIEVKKEVLYNKLKKII